MRLGIVVCLSLAACGDSGIGPETDVGATSTTSANASSSGQGGATGAGGDSSSSSTTTSGAGGSTGTGGNMQAGTFESGSRIKARTTIGDDGSRAPAGMFDSQLGVACTFVGASDDVVRCLPDGPVAGIYFKEGTCTQGLVYTPAGCPTSGGYASIFVDPCGTHRRVYPIGAQYSAQNLYVKSGTNCLSSTSPVATSGGTMRELFAEAAPGLFVGSTVTTEP